jgi:hypothetical protein
MQLIFAECVRRKPTQSMGHSMTIQPSRLVFRLCSSVLAVLTLSSCDANQQPFRQVQFCFNASHGPAQLRTDLKAIALNEGMAIHDISEKSYNQIKSTTPNLLKGMDQSRYISIFLGKSDGMGLGAGNLSLGADQVVVGFTAGKNLSKAKPFSDRVVAQFQKRWKVRDIGIQSGALPIDCSK